MGLCRSEGRTVVWRWLLLPALLLPIARSTAEQTVRVIDGDTIRIGTVSYRLHGIDAPEKRQVCATRDQPAWPCGLAAKDLVSRIVVGRSVSCTVKDTDRYGRLVATCYAGGININQAIVRNGLAWAYREYSDDFAADEIGAADRSLGIWQAPNTTAAEYRARLRNDAGS